MFTENDQLLGTGQAARALNISEVWLRQLALRGRLPFWQSPSGRLFKVADVKALADERERKAI